MLANQLLALLVGGFASVGIYHLVRRLVIGGGPLGRTRAAGAGGERLPERQVEQVSQPLPQQRLPGRTPGTITPH